MKLKRLEIIRLYGTFTKNIVFDERINLLVGINGSGKTSVLNCIDWLLKPDLPRLASTNFQTIRLEISSGNRDLTIAAKHEAGKLTIRDETGSLSTSAITVELLRPLDSIHNERDFAAACELYAGLQPERSERALWRALYALPKPLSVLLDRTISAEIDQQIFFEEGARLQVRKRTKSPIDKVSDVTRARYAAYRERVNLLNEVLKAKIVSSAFNSPFEVDKSIKEDRNVSLEEITRLEVKVTSLISSMNQESSAVRNAQNYFRDAKQLATMAKKDRELQTIFSAQFRQINDLAAAFNEYDRKASASFEPIRSFLDALNSFFRESRKQIGFNDKDGQLGFQFLNSSGKATGAHLGIDRLSSGETQILILLTFLAFSSKENQICLVDEPELSLHPRWQQNFLNAVLSQAPSTMQIVLATHSPEIVAKHRDKCIVLEA